MTFWTPGQFQVVTGGRWLVPPVDADAALAGLSIDSRNVKAGQVFLAVAGEKFDGHDFLDQARAAGAGLLIVADEGKARKAVAKLKGEVEKEKVGTNQGAQQRRPHPGPHPGVPEGEGVNPGILLVPDTVKALQQLAHAYRGVLAQTGCTVIAVGGSNGKTTTRHLIHTALSAAKKGTQSPKSFNNHLGVPLTLLGAGEEDDFVVVEIGTNHPGEIAALARIAAPDIAVLTNIGHEHMEFFRTLEGVAEEESHLLEFIRPGGWAILPGDEALIRGLTPHLSRLPAGVKVLRYGTGADCDAAMRDYVAEDAGGCFTALLPGLTGPQVVRLSLPGEHNARNALAALATARVVGVNPGAAGAALAAVAAVPLRSQILSLGALTILNDCYNANPDSMAAALKMLAEFPMAEETSPFPLRGEGRRVAILGEMRELGDAGPDLHRAIGRLLAERPGIDIAVCIGKLSLFVAEEVERRWPAGRCFAFAEWSEDLPAKVAALLKPGDLVLVKGSRGVGLERLLPAIEAASRSMAE